MHFLKQLGAMTVLGALFAHTAAVPAPAPADASPVSDSLEPREDLADSEAVVNVYSGSSCDGGNTQYSVSGAGAYNCRAIGGESIEVSARYAHTCHAIVSCFLFYLRLSFLGIIVSLFLITCFKAGTDE